MPGQARLTDMVVCVCCCHLICIPTIGFFITGDTTVYTDNLPTVRALDIAMCVCGHPTFVVSFSGDTYSSNRGNARLGDAVVACPIGVIVTASGDVFTDG